MFHYYKIPYFTCTFFTKFAYNEYIGPYFLSHVVLRFSPVNSPRLKCDAWDGFAAGDGGNEEESMSLRYRNPWVIGVGDFAYRGWIFGSRNKSRPHNHPHNRCPIQEDEHGSTSQEALTSNRTTSDRSTFPMYVCIYIINRNHLFRGSRWRGCLLLAHEHGGKQSITYHLYIFGAINSNFWFQSVPSAARPSKQRVTSGNRLEGHGYHLGPVLHTWLALRACRVSITSHRW
jgi:hypothetical protein